MPGKIKKDLNHLSYQEWERAAEEAIVRSLLNRPVNPVFFRWVQQNKPYLLFVKHEN